MSSEKAIIRAEGVKKTYDTGKVTVEALRGVDLQVRQGELAGGQGQRGIAHRGQTDHDRPAPAGQIAGIAGAAPGGPVTTRPLGQPDDAVGEHQPLPGVVAGVDQRRAAGGAGVGGERLEALLAVWLLRRVGFDNALERVRDAIALAIFAALLSPVPSATIGVTSLDPTACGNTIWSAGSAPTIDAAMSSFLAAAQAARRSASEPASTRTSPPMGWLALSTGPRRRRP